MDRIILQVPMSRELKDKAHQAALDLGFSSLQETIRVLLSKLSARQITFTLQQNEEVVHLSKRAEKRYRKIEKDIEKGIGITKTKNLDELFRLLEA